MDNKYIHTEKELFARIAQGDEQAYKAVFDHHFLKLVTYASRILSSDLWAEEVVQDVFLKLWNIRSTLNTIENPGAFLNRMVLNRVRDQLKRQQREIRLQHYLYRMAENSGVHATRDHFDYRMGEKLFTNAVAGLPKQRAAIFKMRHEQGLTYDEIGRELNISKFTVRNQLHLALQYIRAYLLKYGDISGLIICFIIFLPAFF